MPKVSAEYLAERRSHILSSAARRFARDGFHRTTMQDVIAEAGLSPGAVYRYFKSKDDIIAAIAVESMRSIEAAVRASLDRPQPFAELVEGLPSELLKVADSSARVRLAVQVWSESLRNATVGDAVLSGVAGLKAAITERVAAAQAAGEIESELASEEVARVILALMQGFIVQRAWNPKLDPVAFGRAIHIVLSA